MTRTVWKYSIPYFRETVGTFFIPSGAKLVHVAGETLNPGSFREQAVSLWFEVDPTVDKEPRVFELFGTGHDIPDGAGKHVGAVIDPPLVLHLYERSPAAVPQGGEPA